MRRVLSIGLWNSLSLTMIPFLIYFQLGVTFLLVALDKIFLTFHSTYDIG